MILILLASQNCLSALSFKREIHSLNNFTEFSGILRNVFHMLKMRGFIWLFWGMFETPFKEVESAASLHLHGSMWRSYDDYWIETYTNCYRLASPHNFIDYALAVLLQTDWPMHASTQLQLSTEASDPFQPTIHFGNNRRHPNCMETDTVCTFECTEVQL